MLTVIHPSSPTSFYSFVLLQILRFSWLHLLKVKHLRNGGLTDKQKLKRLFLSNLLIISFPFFLRKMGLSLLAGVQFHLFGVWLWCLACYWHTQQRAVWVENWDTVWWSIYNEVLGQIRFERFGLWSLIVYWAGRDCFFHDCCCLDR